MSPIQGRRAARAYQLVIGELRVALQVARHQLMVQTRYRNRFVIDLLGHLLATLPIILTAWAFSDGRFSARLAAMTGLPDQFTFIMLGLIAFTALGVGNMVMLDSHVAGGIATEMETGTLERLFTTPVHRVTLVMGISLYYLVLFTYQSVTLFAGAVLVFGFEPSLTGEGLLWGALCLLLLLGLNLFLGIIGASLIMAFKDGTVYTLLIHRPMAMVSGAYFLVELIPHPFKLLAYLNPLAYAIDAFRGALTGRTLLLASLPMEMAVVAGMVVAVGIAALLLFRRMMVRLERTGALALF